MNKKVDITYLLDRSGSMRMNGKWQEATYSLQNFVVENQKEKGECTFSLYVFDNKYEEAVAPCPINTVAPGQILGEIKPRGMTRFYDAIAETIDNVGKRLEKMPEKDRPDKVLVCILSDGMENNSQKYPGLSGLSKIKEKIQHQETKYSWEFIWAGAGVDAKVEGEKLGMKSVNTETFEDNWQGVRAGASYIVGQTLSYRK